jgi:hypothetical protein
MTTSTRFSPLLCQVLCDELSLSRHFLIALSLLLSSLQDALQLTTHFSLLLTSLPGAVRRALAFSSLSPRLISAPHFSTKRFATNYPLLSTPLSLPGAVRRAFAFSSLSHRFLIAFSSLSHRLLIAFSSPSHRLLIALSLLLSSLQDAATDLSLLSTPLSLPGAV